MAFYPKIGQKGDVYVSLTILELELVSFLIPLNFLGGGINVLFWEIFF
jgi:hypothetical protein|tara:strand:+ start:299 stop:442 length:144 start_codon:yes stop_codon:yes gene_type:complete